MSAEVPGKESTAAKRVLLMLVVGTVVLAWPAVPAGWMAALQRSLLLPLGVGSDVRIAEVVMTRGALGQPEDLRLTAMVSGPARSAPAAIVVSTVRVGAQLQTLLLVAAVLLLIPVRRAREWPLRLVCALPCLAVLEFATTSLQLTAPLAAAQAQLDLSMDPGWRAAWSLWVESGGRIALAVSAALCVVPLAESLSRSRSGAERSLEYRRQ